MSDRPFTQAADFLGRRVAVQVDRPLGSRHPQHGHRYPVNYGFIPDTLAPDGEPLDAYVLGIAAPLATFNGRCIALIHRLDDDDDKLIVVPDGKALSDAEILAQVAFQEQHFTPVLVRPPVSRAPDADSSLSQAGFCASRR